MSREDEIAESRGSVGIADALQDVVIVGVGVRGQLAGCHRIIQVGDSQQEFLSCRFFLAQFERLLLPVIGDVGLSLPVQEDHQVDLVRFLILFRGEQACLVLAPLPMARRDSWSRPAELNRLWAAWISSFLERLTIG